MEKVQEVCCGRPQAFDSPLVELVDGTKNLVFLAATAADIQKAPEGTLVFSRFIDVRNAQLRFPQKGVVRAFEDLPLLGNRADDGLERRTSVGVSEASCLNVFDNLDQASAKGPEVLQPLLPEEPTLIGSTRIIPPPSDHDTERIV